MLAFLLDLWVGTVGEIITRRGADIAVEVRLGLTGEGRVGRAIGKAEEIRHGAVVEDAVGDGGDYEVLCTTRGKCFFFEHVF